MKLKSVIAAVGIILAITLPACTNADSPQMPTGADAKVEAIENTPLAKVLVSTIGQSQKTEDDYILYDAESDSFLTMTASEYELAKAFATLVVRE